MKTIWVSYGHFVMKAIAYSLAESGEWRGEVQIKRKNSNKIQPFAILEKTFKTKKETINYSIEYGKLIIDGKIPGCRVEDIWI